MAKQIEDDHTAYLRTPDMTIMIHDYRHRRTSGNELTDDDPEFALIKQAFEGLSGSADSLESKEQQMELVYRFFGGDPEENQLGLHDITQEEAENLRRLLLCANATYDPYFED